MTKQEIINRFIILGIISEEDRDKFMIRDYNDILNLYIKIMPIIVGETIKTYNYIVY